MPRHDRNRLTLTDIMNITYNIAVNAMNSALRLYSKCLGKNCRRKFPLFAKGQQGLLDRVAAEMSGERQGPTVWFHAASLGEYAVARPLIDMLKKAGPCTVVLTFFSPSGYQALKDNHPGVDHLFYLPLDTRHNAKRFIEIVNPQKAVFIISEYWPNYLQQLKFHSVPTYLVSAIVREDSQFFRWYGKIYSKSLSAFTRIFVLNESSRFNLRMLGYTDVTVSGDPLFDNAALVARTPWSDQVFDAFTAGHKTFIAGSISDSKDLDLVATLAHRHPDTKFIFVPHSLNRHSIESIEEALKGRTLRYTDCNADTDFSNTQVLIADTMGMLARIYRYGTWAYVGGGFTPLLHSVIEATVYGLPVAFGPMIHRKVTPQQLIELGIGCKVTDSDELDRWWTSLAYDDAQLASIRSKALEYVDSNVGATNQIIDTIKQGLWEKS